MAKSGWLVGAIILLTSLGIAGTIVPLRPCGICDGLALKSTPASRVDCPDCGDRGKVSVFRALMGHRVAESVGGVVRSCRNPESALLLLKTAIEADGKTPGTFLFENSSAIPAIAPRFVVANERRYLILLIRWPAPSGGYTEGVSVLLLSLEGSVLDRVDVLYSAFDTELAATVLDAPAPDGGRITINPKPGDALPSSYRLFQWQRPSREGFVQGASGDVGRLAIRERRLEVLAPEGK